MSLGTGEETYLMRSVTAFCPAHISGYFRPCPDPNPRIAGSIGGGIVIDAGVTITLSPAPVTTIEVFLTRPEGTRILEATISPPLSRLFDMLGITAQVSSVSPLPSGCGYGLSAAALLAAVHAANRLFSLRLSDAECTMHAHICDVVSRSGLGDVSALQGGGWVIRTTPGPGGYIRRRDDRRKIHAISFSPIPTGRILEDHDLLGIIVQAYPERDPETLDEFFRYARNFTCRSGLASDRIRKVLSACEDNDIPASMTMLGEGVFALGEEGADILKSFGEVFSFSISRHGPEIIEET